jgi:glycerol-3-phosphate dehydrogenase (NAD+)
MRTATSILLYGLALLSPWSIFGPNSNEKATMADALVNPPSFRSSSSSSVSRTSRPAFLSSTSLQMKASTPPPYPVRIAVMGGGNFGLAMAAICARQGHPTTLLVRGEDIAAQINTNHTHPRYMQGITLPSRIRATTDPKDCLPDATYIIHAVPCQYSRKFLEGVKEYIPPGIPILSVSKGIETISLGFMADILRECLGEDRPLAFLSGPSFAREIIEGVATAVVIASEDLDLARDLACLLSDDNFKCFTSQDVIGVEIGGAVKNVIAVGAGMCEGLGLGTNAMSGLVTRGCNEMRRLGLAFGARPSTIAGLSGTLKTLLVRFDDSFIWYAMQCNAMQIPSDSPIFHF